MKFAILNARNNVVNVILADDQKQADSLIDTQQTAILVPDNSIVDVFYSYDGFLFKIRASRVKASLDLQIALQKENNYLKTSVDSLTADIKLIKTKLNIV